MFKIQTLTFGKTIMTVDDHYQRLFIYPDQFFGQIIVIFISLLIFLIICNLLTLLI